MQPAENLSMVREARNLGAVTMVVAALLAVLASPPAMAATYSVNTTGDPAGAGCAGGTCSLRQAIAVVNAGAGGDRINLPAGRIVLGLGILSVNKPVTIAGAGARSSIVDANSTSDVISFNAGASPSIAEDLTFTGGFGSSTTGVSNGATLRLTAVAVTGNVATGFTGGGIYNAAGGNLTLERSTISGNSAGTIGGAIYNLNVITITNSTISGNTANTTGSNWQAGGLYTNGTATVVNSTIVGNTAFRGSGVDVASGSTASFKNTIIAQNTATGAGQPGNCQVFGTLTSQGGNLENTDTCNFVQATDLRNTPAGLGPLQDNGGSTNTWALLSGSMAIDRGIASGCPATDQRGVARPQQGGCDVGAYEFAPPGTATGNPANVKASSVLLAGTLVPNLRATTYRFEYGTTTAYGATTTTQGIGSGNAAVPVSAAVTGLKAATTYHYRLLGTNADAAAGGADRTFRTARFAGSRLVAKKLAVDSKGRVALRISCPADVAGGTCKNVADLQSVKRKAKLLGRGRFSVAAGKTVKKRLRLNKAGRRLAGTRRKGRLRLVLTTRDQVGNLDRNRYQVTLRAAR